MYALRSRPRTPASHPSRYPPGASATGSCAVGPAIGCWSMSPCTCKDASVNDPWASRPGVCATGHCCHSSRDRGSRLFPDGNGQRCRHAARLPADHGGGDERVTASVCRCSSQPSQDIAGVTPGAGILRLWRLIRVLRLIRGTGMHRIRHEAWIRHENAAEAADVRVATPRPGLVAPEAPKRNETGL
jgi:hypothetical protein